MVLICTVKKAWLSFQNVASSEFFNLTKPWFSVFVLIACLPKFSGSSLYFYIILSFSRYPLRVLRLKLVTSYDPSWVDTTKPPSISGPQRRSEKKSEEMGL